MKRIAGIILVTLLLASAGAGTAHAQFGFGGGVAAVGDNIRQAGGDLADLLSKDSIQYGDVAGSFGFYLTGRLKYGFGAVRLIGDISYVFFPAESVTLVDYDINQNQTGNATFDVGATFIPLNAGLEVTIPIPVARPYLGAQFTYTVINRTYTKINSDGNGVTPDVANKSAGENEAGLVFGAGVELAIGPVALDLGARYNLVNLFTTADLEKSIRYLQVGAVVYFGDLLNESDDYE